jgi:hypothetical protein
LIPSRIHMTLPRHYDPCSRPFLYRYSTATGIYKYLSVLYPDTLADIGDRVVLRDRRESRRPGYVFRLSTGSREELTRMIQMQ